MIFKQNQKLSFVRWRAVFWTGAALALMPSCKESECIGELPAVRVKVTLRSGINGAAIRSLRVSLPLAPGNKPVSIPIQGQLLDGATSFELQLGSVVSDDYQTTLTVSARDTDARELASGSTDFGGSGESCESVEVVLHPAAGDGGADGPAADSKPDHSVTDGPTDAEGGSDTVPSPDKDSAPADSQPCSGWKHLPLRGCMQRQQRGGRAQLRGRKNPTPDALQCQIRSRRIQGHQLGDEANQQLPADGFSGHQAQVPAIRLVGGQEHQVEHPANRSYRPRDHTKPSPPPAEVSVRAPKVAVLTKAPVTCTRPELETNTALGLSLPVPPADSRCVTAPLAAVYTEI